MNWLKKYFEPKDTSLEDLDLDDFRAAFSDEQVRNVWFHKVIGLLRDANLAIETLLDKEDKERRWETIAVERRTMVRMIRLILEARQDIENGRAQEERENRIFERYQGAAAPLDNRR